MSDNVETITIGIPRNIQASIAQFRDESKTRLERLQSGMRKDWRNVAGMLVMMRATAGDFDERVTEIEERVATLEARA